MNNVLKKKKTNFWSEHFYNISSAEECARIYVILLKVFESKVNIVVAMSQLCGGEV